MKIKLTVTILLILFINACSSEDADTPTGISSSIYTIHSAFHHEAEDCTGEETNVIDSMDMTITLNNDLSYSYSFNDSTGYGNWADGTLNLNGNSANFTINENNLEIHMFSSIDTLYSSTYLPVHMIVYPNSCGSAYYNSIFESNCIIDEIPNGNILNQDDCESNDGIWIVQFGSESRDSTIIYQNGTWTDFLSGYCDTESDNQIETIEDCQSVNGAWVAYETGTWDAATQVVNMEPGDWYNFAITGDSLTLYITETISGGGDEEERYNCYEIILLLENQVYQTDVDCTDILLTID